MHLGLGLCSEGGDHRCAGENDTYLVEESHVPKQGESSKSSVERVMKEGMN